MITVLTATVTLPAWLFFALLAGLILLDAFLMWCNHDQAATIRRQARRLSPKPTRTKDERIPLSEITGGGQL